MEYEKDPDLEVDPLTVIKIVEQCLQLALWAYQHKEEIKAMVRSGWRNAKAIINYLKQKYGH